MTGVDTIEWRCIYALIALAEHTGDPAFLQVAARIGDNLMAYQTETGLFPRPAPPPRRAGTQINMAYVPGGPNEHQPAREYARTGDEAPLALLHLAAAKMGVGDRLPQAVLDDQYFHCPYRGEMEPHQRHRNPPRTYDWLVFYGPDFKW